MDIKCSRCGSDKVIKNGSYTQNNKKYQKLKCKDCGKYLHYLINESNQTEYQNINVMKQPVGITLDEFRRRHDLHFIVSNVFKELDEELLYEKDDIAKLCKLRTGYPGFNTVLDSNEYEKYKGRAGNKIYWGNPQTIQKLREEGLLI